MQSPCLKSAGMVCFPALKIAGNNVVEAQPEFAFPAKAVKVQPSLEEELLAFKEFGQPTRRIAIETQAHDGKGMSVPALVNEFWTARQRQASSLHEVSYRACFKPQLPRFFIERLTVPGEVVYDPFMGRGTTLIEAALLDRVPWGNDLNPLSAIMAAPRLHPPALNDIEERLRSVDLNRDVACPDELLVFYHPTTLRSLCSLRAYLLEKRKTGKDDYVDRWIALVALNRLTGHSPGVFAVYTLPPHQAVSVASQKRINQQRNQIPASRDVVRIILKKSRQLLADVQNPATMETLCRAGLKARILTGPAEATTELPANSVALVVTSPPFLNIVQYAVDNWLRCWFVGIEAASIRLTVPRKIEDWRAVMLPVFRELRRLLKPGGHVAFEVGEVHGGKTRLEETVLPCGAEAGLKPLLVLINDQKFTKTANCWGIDNMSKGTNTNRVVVF